MSEIRSVGMAMQDATSAPVKPKRKRKTHDFSILFVLIFLVLFGFIMVYSSSYYYAEKAGDGAAYFLIRQAIFAALGFFCMFVISRLNYDKIINFKTVWLLFIICFILMILVDFTSMGAEVNGSKRWLKIGGQTIGQPTEIVKIWVIVFLAYYFDRYKERFVRFKSKCWRIPLVALVLPLGLVFINNLSSTIIVFFVIYLMFMIAAQNKKAFIVFLVFALAFFLACYFFGEQIGGALNKMGFLQDYQVKRIYTWLSPESDTEGSGFQVVQGFYAIGSGGFFGKGLGNSIQKLGFVPEAQNDMIFSIVCEELGLFGAICLMALYSFLIYRMYKVAMNIRNTKGYFIIVGVIIHLSLQVILNICVVTGLIPNTGVSLPFVSYGGTSIALLLCEMGLVFSVIRHDGVTTRKKKRKASNNGYAHGQENQ